VMAPEAGRAGVIGVVTGVMDGHRQRWRWWVDGYRQCG
jgi:hypothetical protein